VALEHFRTQILLLHSQQSTLDVLGAGFNDRYTVHFATSGTEALNTLTETPIHVIVSAQDLPGMSGLDALREAKKRSPDTIGILLAGTDSDDGLEALVGDREVFQIVRGEISSSDLKELIDNATRRVRLVALSESANDQAANPDEPIGEHIVMETSENGSTIISDGTGRMPALKPEKVAVMPNIGGSEIDVLVLTKDEEFLATIRDSARGLHNIHHANTPTQAEGIVSGHKIGVLVTDAAMVGSNIELLTQKLRKSVPRLVAVVAGRRDDGDMLMDLINRGQVYRFLLKPVSPGRARLAIEASVKHHLEAADSAFKGRKKEAAEPAQPKARSMPEPKIKEKPKPKPQPKSEAKPKSKSEAKPKPAPQPKATPPSKPHRSTPPITASPEADRLSDPFEKENAFSQTMTGIASSVGKSLSGASGSIAGSARSALKSSSGASEKILGAALSPLRKPKNLAVAASLLAVVGLGYWLASNRDATAPEPDTEVDPSVPTIVEADVPPPEPTPAVTEAPVESAVDVLLEEARSARSSGYIFTPPGENAVELYVAAKSSAPDNRVVAAELEDVVDQTLGMIEKALLEARTDDAAEGLQMVRLADPDNSRLVFLDAQVRQMQLRDAIDQARAAIRSGRFEDAGNFIGIAEAVNTGDASEIDTLTQELAAARSEQEVDEVLALANERLNENKLIAPSNDNARYYYELALSNDPDNPAAQQGTTIIASKLVLRAREAIDREDFDLASNLLQDAEALDSANSDLASSKTALADAKSKQEAEQQAAAEMQAEIERRAEAERLAEAERQAALERQAELERELEVQRQVEAEKRAELERQLKAQVESEAQKRADLERQMSALAETEAQKRVDLERQMSALADNEAQKRAALERELEGQLDAEADKRAELERQLAARKAADRKRSSAELAAAAVAATNAQTRTVRTTRSMSRPPATNNTRTATEPPKQQVQRPAVAASTQEAALNQLPVERLSPQVERTLTAAANTPAATQNSTPPPAVDTASSEPARVAISQLKRTHYVAPKYPRSAQRRNTSGWVDLGFTVGRDGSVHSIEIIDSTPGTTFDDSATKAVSQWRFEPVLENGEPVEKRASVRMMFSLQ
jgi:TonB family protein